MANNLWMLTPDFEYNFTHTSTAKAVSTKGGFIRVGHKTVDVVYKLIVIPQE